MNNTDDYFSFIYANALSLFERKKSGVIATGDESKSLKMREQWKRICSGWDEDYFNLRISKAGFDPKELTSYLGRVKFGDSVPEQKWWIIFKELMHSLEEDHVTDTFTEWDDANDQDPFPFVELLLPFVRYAGRKLQEGASSGFLCLSGQARASLERGLLRKLFIQFSEVLFKEFQIFRNTRKSGLTLLIEKAIHQIHSDIYKEFVSFHRENGMKMLFGKYPVLARTVSVACQQWIDNNIQFLERWIGDHNRLALEFPEVCESIYISDLQCNLSDSHHHGQTVYIVVMPGERRIVYKPRSIAAEQTWNIILSSCNRELGYDFKTLKTLNLDEYGWMQFCPAGPCSSAGQIRTFYSEAGALLALAFILGASDIHYENLIASGDKPVVIDMETLSHHRMRDDIHFSPGIRSVINAGFGESVLRTSMLPRWIEGEEGRSVDISALSFVHKQTTRVRMPVWKHINTDHMDRGYEFKVSEIGKNALFLNGTPVDSGIYVDDIASGFRQMYDLVLKKRNLFIDCIRPELLKTLTLRFIFRPTYRYYMLLHDVLHPDCMANGAARSIVFDALALDLRSADTIQFQQLWNLLQQEHESLENNDCPYFSASLGGDVLYTSDTIKHCGLLSGPLYPDIERRVLCASPLERDRQIDYIYASFECKQQLDILHASQDNLYEKELLFREPSECCAPEMAEQILLDAALHIGNQICRAALRAKGSGATWMTMKSASPKQTIQIADVGNTFFDGRTGIAMFLASLYAVSNQEKYHKMSCEAIRPVLEELLASAKCGIVTSTSLHGLTGIPGILYGLMTIDNLLQHGGIRHAISEILKELNSDIREEQQPDVLNGVAGTLLCTAAMSVYIPDALSISRRCGEYLLSARDCFTAKGSGWSTFEGRMITGFAHGQAGIAYALDKLGKLTGEVKYTIAAREAVALENSTFSAGVSNWPDLRWTDSPKQADIFADGWCHGAPGIALARAAMTDSGGFDLSRDIQAGVSSIFASRSGRTDHLCCGSAGRILILNELSLYTGNENWRSASLQAATHIVGQAGQNGNYRFWWTPKQYILLPSLFQGSAGIGYAFLRMIRPSRIPNVLLCQG